MVYFLIVIGVGAFCIIDGAMSIIKEVPKGLNLSMFTIQSVKDFSLPYGSCMIIFGIAMTLTCLGFLGYIEAGMVFNLITTVIAIAMIIIVAVCYKKILKKAEKPKKRFYTGR